MNSRSGPIADTDRLFARYSFYLDTVSFHHAFAECLAARVRAYGGDTYQAPLNNTVILVVASTSMQDPKQTSTAPGVQTAQVPLDYYRPNEPIHRALPGQRVVSSRWVGECIEQGRILPIEDGWADRAIIVQAAEALAANTGKKKRKLADRVRDSLDPADADSLVALTGWLREWGAMHAESDPKTWTMKDFYVWCDQKLELDRRSLSKAAPNAGRECKRTRRSSTPRPKELLIRYGHLIADVLCELPAMRAKRLPRLGSPHPYAGVRVGAVIPFQSSAHAGDSKRPVRRSASGSASACADPALAIDMDWASMDWSQSVSCPASPVPTADGSCYHHHPEAVQSPTLAALDRVKRDLIRQSCPVGIAGSPVTAEPPQIGHRAEAFVGHMLLRALCGKLDERWRENGWSVALLAPSETSALSPATASDAHNLKTRTSTGAIAGIEIDASSRNRDSTNPDIPTSGWGYSCCLVAWSTSCSQPPSATHCLWPVLDEHVEVSSAHLRAERDESVQRQVRAWWMDKTSGLPAWGPRRMKVHEVSLLRAMYVCVALASTIAIRTDTTTVPNPGQRQEGERGEEDGQEHKRLEVILDAQPSRQTMATDVLLTCLALGVLDTQVAHWVRGGS